MNCNNKLNIPTKNAALIALSEINSEYSEDRGFRQHMNANIMNVGTLGTLKIIQIIHLYESIRFLNKNKQKRKKVSVKSRNIIK